MFLRKKIDTSSISIPIPDDAEAAWESENFLFDEDVAALVEQEGELALDVYLIDDQVVVRTPVAGVKPEDLQISLHNDMLTIRGKRTDESGTEDRHYITEECHWGSFSRSIVLPVPVFPDQVRATMKNGVLIIILKRGEPATVKVKVEED